MSGVCRSSCSPWAVEDDVCTPCDSIYDFPVGLLEDTLAVASDILFELSGRQFPGSCQETVRPCSQHASLDGAPNRDVEYSAVYRYPSACSCQRSSSCTCSRIPSIRLGAYPITAIDEVLIDGVALPTTAYTVHDWRWLVRIDGETLPCCQNMLLASTEEDTFEVTYTYGSPPPPAGVMAAAELACQLALSCQPETLGECRLPSRVTNITRQGVSMVVLDPMSFLDNGRTGLYQTDLFIAAYNKHGLTRRASVISPDLRPAVRRVTGIS